MSTSTRSFISWLHWFFHLRRHSQIELTPLHCTTTAERAATDILDIQWYPQNLECEYTAWLLGVDSFREQTLTEMEMRALAELQQIVTGTVDTMQVVPRLPAIIPQLMQSLKDDSVSIAQLAQHIKRDPVLVGEVIGLSNSPYYRRQKKILSIEQAVLLLGQNGLRQLISRVAFYPIFNLRTGTMTHLTGTHLWAQSEQCALICRCLADHKKADTFAAYLAGLVANIGVLAGLHFIDQCLHIKTHGIPHAQEFYTEFIRLAKQFSYRIVTDWGFPEPVILAIYEQTDLYTVEPQSILGQILNAGDHCSKYCMLKAQARLPATTQQQPLINHPCYSPFL
jgi:HD-like signal output (HDOD) protein